MLAARGHDKPCLFVGGVLLSHINLSVSAGPWSSMTSEASRSRFRAKGFWGGLGYQGQTTTHVSETSGFCCLADEGGKATKPFFSGTCVVFWPWYPMPLKNNLAKRPLRDPFDKRHLINHPWGQDGDVDLRKCRKNHFGIPLNYHTQILINRASHPV